MEVNKKVLIIGGNGHGSVIASCINDNRNRYNDFEWEVAGFINDFDTNVDDYPVLGKLSDISNLAEKGYFFAWGIHLIGRNPLTHKLFNSCRIPEDRLATIIHRSAFIGDNVVIEPGSLVMANTYIAPRTHIGKCTMIKANVNIGHDVICGPLCHFAMGAIVGSFSRIGVCSDVALGAVVLEHRVIGDYAMLGASSLLTCTIPDCAVYVGTPARFMRTINEQ